MALLTVDVCKIPLEKRFEHSWNPPDIISILAMVCIVENATKRSARWTRIPICHPRSVISSADVEPFRFVSINPAASRSLTSHSSINPAASRSLTSHS